MSRNSSLFRHISRVHSGLQPYVCARTGCSKSFKTADDLRQHTQCVHKSSTQQYSDICCSCRSLFRSKQNFEKHLLSRSTLGHCPVKRGPHSTHIMSGVIKARILLYGGFQSHLRFFPEISVVEVKQSLIPNAGLGLFLTKPVCCGEPLTLYDGSPEPKPNPIEAGVDRSLGDASSHFASLSPHPWIIKGIRADSVLDSSALLGRGLASLCNHCSSPNARLAVVSQPAHPLELWYCDPSGFVSCPGVVLVATSDLKADTELTINYGRQTCERLGIRY